MKSLKNHEHIETLTKDFKLKIMTFDTCQGEERDVVFYSMVATKQKDKLNSIFAKSLTISTEIDDEGSIRKQRLNVGFSRVKELAYFVLSKNIEDFQGAIKEALLHFYKELQKEDYYTEKTDKNSPIEEEIKNYIINTNFFKENKVFFKAQFPIGDYLSQIDKNYVHPKYKVDFLLSVNTEKGTKNIIIEYDGVQYHFKDGVDKYNYVFLQKEEDIFRQNILESYDYIFLRLNKFNLTNNPVEFIDSELRKLVS